MNRSRNLFEKVWDRHVVAQEKERPAVLYVDLHLLHEVTSPQAFEGLRTRGLKVRRPDRTVATMDHSTPTVRADWDAVGVESRDQMKRLERNCKEHGITCYPLGHERNGIVHVIGPELGLTQPGQVIVCGDSHTSTHGAFGALAFGIGTSEVEHVLATQCLLQDKPKTLEVRVEGSLGPGVVAKDLILALCAQLGTGGATGHVIEYTGQAIQSLGMEGRMTVCNMSIELGARAGMIAPDEVTFDHVYGREYAPKGAAWDRAVDMWRGLARDPGATYDRTVTIDASEVAPMLSYGTNPGMSAGVGSVLPTPSSLATAEEQSAMSRALDYMGLEGGGDLRGQKVDVVFIGSCTNSRITDLREAARVFAGRKVADRVRTLIVPGSHEVRRRAEEEGLDRLFLEAGAEWRQPGCSMCIAMNGDHLEPGQVAVSTSNRNFEGRQGRGGRTLLASPLTAAAAAVTGYVTDVRELLNGKVSS